MKSKLLTPKNLYLLISFVILIPLVIYHGNRSNKAFCEQSKADLYSRDFKGVVIRKYLDSLNHMCETIELQGSTDTINEWLYSGEEMDALYSRLEHGDSLIKEKGTNVYIRKSGNEKSAYRAVINCDD